MDKKMPDHPSLVRKLTAIRNNVAAPSNRLKLVSPAHEQVLFVYAQNQLQMGRNSLDSEEQDVCLRLLPKSKKLNLRRSSCISKKHCWIAVDNGLACLVDTKSHHGTFLDGKRLQAYFPEPLTGKHRLEIAHTLTLSTEVIFAPQEKNDYIIDVAEVNSHDPSVYLSRENNKPAHAYLLLPGRVRLGITEKKRIIPDPAGQVELLHADNMLWLVSSSPAAERCHLLAAGSFFYIGDECISVQAIYAEDQK